MAKTKHGTLVYTRYGQGICGLSSIASRDFVQMQKASVSVVNGFRASMQVISDIYHLYSMCVSVRFYLKCLGEHAALFKPYCYLMLD